MEGQKTPYMLKMYSKWSRSLSIKVMTRPRSFIVPYVEYFRVCHLNNQDYFCSHCFYILNVQFKRAFPNNVFRVKISLTNVVLVNQDLSLIKFNSGRLHTDIF